MYNSLFRTHPSEGCKVTTSLCYERTSSAVTIWTVMDIYSYASVLKCFINLLFILFIQGVCLFTALLYTRESNLIKYKMIL